MSLVRCDSCEGRRHYMGLGGMRQTCKKCGGVGHVNDVAAAPVVMVKRRRVVKPVEVAKEG